MKTQEQNHTKLANANGGGRLNKVLNINSVASHGGAI